jgi:hypothetical protein
MAKFKCPLTHHNEVVEFAIPEGNDAGREFFYPCGARVTGADIIEPVTVHHETGIVEQGIILSRPVRQGDEWQMATVRFDDGTQMCVPEWRCTPR